jgi:hypothetical protein
VLLAEQQPVASPPSWLCRLWSTITQEFVEVCDHILPFFDHLGPVFAFARVEFAAKASSLRDTAEQHAHLHELVAADRAANRATVRQVDDTYMPATVVVFSATCAAPRAHQLTITLPASSLPFIAVAGQVKNSPTRNLHRLAAAIHFVHGVVDLLPHPETTTSSSSRVHRSAAGGVAQWRRCNRVQQRALAPMATATAIVQVAVAAAVLLLPLQQQTVEAAVHPSEMLQAPRMKRRWHHCTRPLYG